MADANPERRVEILEEKVDQLRDVRARIAAVESQIVQLRTEMRSEFSGVRTEMRGLEQGLRAEMRALNDEARVEMRVLHEEVISRIALLQEGGAGAHPNRGTRSSRKKKL
jgi:hypothetical protein